MILFMLIDENRLIPTFSCNHICDMVCKSACAHLGAVSVSLESAGFDYALVVQWTYSVSAMRPSLLGATCSPLWCQLVTP